MNASRFLAPTLMGALSLSLFFAEGQEPGSEKPTKGQADQPAAGPKQGQPKKEQPGKIALAQLVQDAAKGVTSAKENGVELAIKLKAVPNKESTDDIQIAWTLRYTGPRPPLIIVKPTLEQATGSTAIDVWAAPKGKDYALLASVINSVGPFDPYGERRPKPEPKPVIGTIPPVDPNEFPRTKDQFVTVPAGKSATGTITVSGAKLKKLLRTKFPGEFDAKGPPRLFVGVSHAAYDRAEDFNLDAWTGFLYIPGIELPPLTKW